MMLTASHRVLAHPAERESGDAVVARIEGSRAVFAIVDGLGHGPLAAHAAAKAVTAIDASFAEPDVERILRAIHAALTGTRGAAATVLTIDGETAQSCGVGNVALRSHRYDLPFVLSPGILGVQVRRYKTMHAKVREGQRIVLHSDGIASDLPLESYATLDTDGAAAAIARAHRKPTDDAAVLVLDVRR